MKGEPMLSWKILATVAVVFGLVLAAPAARAQPAQSDDIVGAWESESLKLEFFKVDAEYQARILWGDRIVESDGVTFKKDTLNPDPSLRSRSLQGIVMVKGLTYQNGEWSGGTAYDASSGRTVNCKAEITEGKLHMRGYVGVSLLGQTVVFQRAAMKTSVSPVKSPAAKK
jgi:uncharacterized protein (DUF2147 family)